MVDFLLEILYKLIHFLDTIEENEFDAHWRCKKRRRKKARAKERIFSVETISELGN